MNKDRLYLILLKKISTNLDIIYYFNENYKSIHQNKHKNKI